jgi:hypothetical protein
MKSLRQQQADAALQNHSARSHRMYEPPKLVVYGDAVKATLGEPAEDFEPTGFAMAGDREK